MLIPVLVLVLLISCVCLRLYYYAILPSLRNAIRFQIFELRDVLRNARYEDSAPETEFAYSFLESRLNAMTHLADRLNVGRLFEVMHRRDVSDRTPELAKFEKEAPKALQDIYTTAVIAMMKVMLLNTPVLSLFAAFFAILKFATVVVFSELMWEELSHDNSCELAAA